MSAQPRRPDYDRELLARRGLDIDLAYQCVELAWLAYRDPELANRRALTEFGYRSYHHLSRRQGRDHAFVVSDARRIIVAFRGTDDRRDWITNLRAWTAPTPYGRVHRGYHDVMQDMIDELREVLTARREDRLPLVLTGHSMGGALAVLAGLMLAEDRLETGGIYTFGQPQVGNRNFSRSFLRRYRGPYFRFVNGADAIAAWTYGKRAMLGTTCYFDQRGNLVFGDHLSEVPRLGLRFHRIDHYRYHMRLNRLRLRVRDEASDATVLMER